MSGPDGFKGNSIKNIKKELIPILLTLDQKTEEEWTLPNSLYEDTVTLMPNQTKTLQIKKSTGQYFWWIYTQKSSAKYQHTEFFDI